MPDDDFALVESLFLGAFHTGQKTSIWWLAVVWRLLPSASRTVEVTCTRFSAYARGVTTPG